MSNAEQTVTTGAHNSHTPETLKPSPAVDQWGARALSLPSSLSLLLLYPLHVHVHAFCVKPLPDYSVWYREMKYKDAQGNDHSNKLTGSIL